MTATEASAMSAHLFALAETDVATTTDDWYTPRWIFAAAGVTFDIDVAAPVTPEFRTAPARRYLTVIDDGLTSEWDGLIWCNPPYSSAQVWVDRWASHPDGVLLVPAVKAEWLGDVMAACEAFTLLRVDFLRPSGAKAELMWPNILAGRGRGADVVARIAASDKCARGAWLRGEATA